MSKIKKINVAVFMGGKSSEHEVSLKSGTVVFNSLDTAKYNLKPVIIQKNGSWRMPSGFGVTLKSPMKTYPPGTALDILVREKVNVVFLALHGSYGEDGTIQGLLEMSDIPYTGSNVLASSLAMHKVKTLEIYEYYGLLTPKRINFTRWDSEEKLKQIRKSAATKIKFPCIVKPVQLGSSVATFKVDKPVQLKTAMQKVVQHDTEGMIEEYILGDELTCAVLGQKPGEKPLALPPTMIVPKTSRFFDYKAKYTPGASEEITPAPISAKLTRQVQKIAVKAHEILGCGSMSRTDILLRKGKCYLLETNTIPGMTETSLYPQAAKSAGMELPELFDHVIRIAQLYHHAKKSKI